MSPQRSNRANLVEGALRCLEKLPPERVTARAIAAEAGANPASITYHFDSKDDLITEAAITGLDRWLEEIDRALGDVGSADPADRFRRASDEIEKSRARHAGLARNYLSALAKGQHDMRVRRLLAEGFRRSRPNVSAVLGLGDDRAGEDAGGLALSLFHGMLIQALLDPELAIEGERLEQAQARLKTLL